MSWSFYNKEGKLLYDVVGGSVGDAATLGGTPPTGFVRIGAPGLNTGNVDVDGSLTLPLIANLTSDTTLTSADRTVLVNTQTPAAPITVTLPASPLTGQVYEIKDKGVSGAGYSHVHNITVDGNGNNIQGSATYVISSQGQGISLAYNGFTWHVISDTVPVSGSINADTLDLLDSTQFLRSDTADTAAGSITFSEVTQFNKSIYGPVVYTAVNLLLDDTHRTVLVDPSGATRTITLPASPVAGQQYEIRDVGAGGLGTSATYPITIARNGNDIDGNPSDAVININGNGIILVSDGSDWFTLAQRLPPTVLTANLDDLNDVTITGVTEGELLRYDTPAGEWVNTPKVKVDDFQRLNLAAAGSGTGISIGSDLGLGNDVTIHAPVNKTVQVTGRLYQQGVSAAYVAILENGVTPAGDTYDVALPDDNTLLCLVASGDLFVRLPNLLNTNAPYTGDTLTIKDADGSAGINTLAIVAEGVRARNLPTLALDSPVGVSDATTTVTPGGLGVDEVQNFQVTGSGTYNIDFDGQITTGLTETSDATAVQSAINALSPHPNYGHFSVSVSGVDASSGLNVTFDGGALIDGLADFYITTPYQGVRVVYYGGNWFIV